MTSLSGLTIGTVTLTPSFDPDTTEYTATTTNATNKVTATPSDADDTVTIEVNDVEIENGSSASWDEGENTLVVTVTDSTDPSLEEVYTVTVTRE